MKTALVIGATGLTGKYITRYLLDSDDYNKVIVFSRRAFADTHARLVNHIVDFEQLDDWAHLLKGDDFFSAMGTTIKQAGSKKAFYKVDFTYQSNVIEAAASNGVKRLFLISSPNANARSPVFYLKVKGELDEFVAKLGLETLVYFKPSIIHGNREVSRFSEMIGFNMLRTTTAWVPGLKKYKPISGEELGRAIVNCAESDLVNGVHTFELGEIFRLL